MFPLSLVLILDDRKRLQKVSSWMRVTGRSQTSILNGSGKVGLAVIGLDGLVR